ncbi:hypothetical protein [Nocardioides sp. 1609]|uniref:hypothetical protein n=1 Tax=Nocardioides sp. 1609 TaxID=2508327 RepID=UPI00106F6BB1|nr:hypothetical protein [Nocardioides sp. 1609]
MTSTQSAPTYGSAGKVYITGQGYVDQEYAASYDPCAMTTRCNSTEVSPLVVAAGTLVFDGSACDTFSWSCIAEIAMVVPFAKIGKAGNSPASLTTSPTAAGLPTTQSTVRRQQTTGRSSAESSATPAKGKGIFGVGSGTASQASRAGESWVGDGYRIASDGKTLVSRDGLRTFRPPSWKPDLGKYLANFSYWIGERAGKPVGNGHLDVTGMVP